MNWGIEVVLWFQQFSPALDIPFKVLTFLGDKEFYMLLMPMMYWCINRRVGARLFVLLLFSAYLNEIAKLLVDQPRPFNYDPRVIKFVHEDSGGLPSGHTQSAVVVWGYLAWRFKIMPLWLLAGFLVLAIPLSRIYLGAHFPTDLLGGYAIGAVVLFVFFRLDTRIWNWCTNKGIWLQLGVSMGLPVVLLLFVPPGNRGLLTAVGAFMGLTTGVVLERRWVWFCSDGPWWQQVTRYLAGMVVLIGIWYGLRIGFEQLEPAGLYRVLRYALIGLWGGLGAPWLFVKLKLAEKER
ncbi:MAG: phosphatase PAP2 family protein [Deltaproteobacteria bacterium]|nr:phosphatase PAP2 family protein [Deltaproteobacteria bacterium]